MLRQGGIEPIDYLAIGHVSLDRASEGAELGGTAAYSALTAEVLGKRAGLVTSFNEDLSIGELERIPISNAPAETNTVFETEYRAGGRMRLLSRAENLELFHIPELWSTAPIVHLAPIAQEIPIPMVRQFEGSFLGMTPKGWLRGWDESGRLGNEPWPEADFTLRFADAVVVSQEGIQGNEGIVREMAAAARVLVVTRGTEGASLYTMGEEHFIPAPQAAVRDITGAEDIFSAAFFCNLHGTKNALGAARFASQMAAISVSRIGLESVPTKDEIYDLMFEVP
ncbi:MAG: PfkB family carbohydrate kinase [Anaerolineae bacterium]|nr:PfkB family carbohydrate kinase [Anaerolineae bacterium]